MELRNLILIMLLILSLNDVAKSVDVKSSLTFVIDDTASMSGEIYQVKSGVNAIFDKVMNSKSSQIENFILITFNDPEVELRTITKDSATFKNALTNIQVHGGDDCPEMAMGGIQMALQESREGSYVYIFTDASAKDYEKYEEVAALSQKMTSQFDWVYFQVGPNGTISGSDDGIPGIEIIRENSSKIIVFVLTGECNGREADDYLVYDKLAKATNGQVFHLRKTEIGQVLKYVEETIENRKTIIATKSYPPGYNNTLTVEINGDTKEIVTAVSGLIPHVSVTDSRGTQMPTTDITRLSEILIVKVVDVKPDVYKVNVGSKSETHVVVSGTTSVHFQHGFSFTTPSTINDTFPQPVPGEKCHLSIELTTVGSPVELRGVEILDMDDNVILEAPLKLVDKDEQLYTTNSITPPDHMFKIAINGYDKQSKTYIKRVSLTPVQPSQTLKTLRQGVAALRSSQNHYIVAPLLLAIAWRLFYCM